MPRRTTRTKYDIVDKALFELLWELAFTYQRLNAVGHRLAGAVRQSPGKASLLRSLASEGPQSVAQLARSRGIARQGIQLMSDQIVTDGLAEYFDNPTHQRAKLIRITNKGSSTLDRMLDDQRSLAKSMAKSFELNELTTSADVLRRLRELLKHLPG